MTRLLARLLVGLPLAVLAAAAQLLVGVVRLGLWLLGRVGFRGARLAGLAATLAGVGWATGVVGVGPAARLAVIGWMAWAIRHHRAAIAQHTAVIRQHAAVRRLTAAMEQHASALAAATRALPTRPTTSTTPAPATTSATATTATPAAAHQAPAAVPWPAADQPPDQGVSALGRYAAAWVRRHSPAAGGTPTRPPRRPPR